MSSRKKPLSGVRVLVGRARHQAGALSSELRKLGAEILEIPFIEIRKPRSFRPLDSALKTLPTYDWLILTSVNGVDAMWDRLEKLHLSSKASTDCMLQELPGKSGASAPRSRAKYHGALAPAMRVAAIGPATKKALGKRGFKVDVVPKEYVAESVVRSLRAKVKGKRVLLVRAKVARDVIPRELRRAGARVDVVEAYETVVPKSSTRRLRAALNDPEKRPHVVTFTSSSTVRNFAQLLGTRRLAQFAGATNGRSAKKADRILMASIGPVTSSTLRELGLRVDIAARQFTIPGLVQAIVKSFQS